jgi:hypothetical protein
VIASFNHPISLTVPKSLDKGLRKIGNIRSAVREQTIHEL